MTRITRKACTCSQVLFRGCGFFAQRWKVVCSVSERLIRLVNDLLDLSKIESGSLKLKREELSPADLVSAAVDGLAAFAQDKEIQIKTNISDAERIHLFGDHDRIVQVLTNLITNAIKFSPPKMIINLVGESQGSVYKLSIIDNGRGIPKAAAHKLFSKFQQVDSSDSREFEGTGLGLAISKAIIDQHGGSIGFESEVGKGSCFWFSLPAVSNGLVHAASAADLQIAER